MPWSLSCVRFGGMTVHAPTSKALGSGFERLRLEHRERRLRAAVTALKALKARGMGAQRPPGLTKAIASFQADLREVRARLGKR